MALVLDGTLGITTNSGTAISASTIGVGGTTPSASGAGITFPATQSASTDANTLDDYEEGSWTPTNPNISFSSAFGLYTKIGNMVYCAFKVIYPSTANASPSKIAGLPFTSGNYTDSCYGGYITYTGYTSSPIQPLVGTGGTVADFFILGNTNGPTNAQLSGVQLRGVIIYQVTP
jgi:hypothetical protein